MTEFMRGARSSFTYATAFGAIIGLLLIFGWAFGASRLGLRMPDALAALIGGITFGGAVGWVQGGWLSAVNGAITRLRWTMATAAGMGLACGMMSWASKGILALGLHPAWTLVLIVLLLAPAGLSFGVFQARLVDSSPQERWSWIGISALGWLGGGFFVLLAILVAPDGEGALALLRSGLVGTLGMAAWAGWWTGGWIARRIPESV